MIFIIIVLLIILFILLSINIELLEPFNIEKDQLITSSYNTDKDTVIVDDNTIFNNIYKINTIIDPNDFRLKFPVANSSETDIGYFLYLSKSSSTTCPHNLEGKTVGYTSRTDLYFIRSIIYGYRMDQSRIRVKQLNPVVPDFNSVDISIIYVYPNSKMYDTISKQNIFIEGFDTIDINRIKLFYPSITLSQKRIKEIFPQNNIFTSKDTIVNIPSSHMIKISPTPDMYSQEQFKTQEQFITRLNVDKDIFNEQYACWGEIETQNKALCNSKYDAFGNKKQYRTEWQKKCESNSDCPYYKINKNYDNEFGGCIKKNKEKYGTCEGILGVKQVGFTKFYDKGRYRPFCEGDDPEKRCFGNNNDYRFAGDHEIRIKNGLRI